MAILTFICYASLAYIVKMTPFFLLIPKRKKFNVAFQTIFAMIILSQKLFPSVCEPL